MTNQKVCEEHGKYIAVKDRNQIFSSNKLNE